MSMPRASDQNAMVLMKIGRGWSVRGARCEYHRHVACPSFHLAPPTCLSHFPPKLITFPTTSPHHGTKLCQPLAAQPRCAHTERISAHQPRVKKARLDVQRETPGAGGGRKKATSDQSVDKDGKVCGVACDVPAICEVNADRTAVSHAVGQGKGQEVDRRA